MSLKIPPQMYSKGPKNNPAPMKSWDTSGNRAYGDSMIRMLDTSPPMPKLGSLVITVEKKRK